jgi:putative tryptophan/tyrosine transport system substrate-binding protein
MLIQFARNYAILGDTGKQFARASEAHRLLAGLAAEKPNDMTYQRDLSVAYNEVGDVLVAQGKLDEALKAYRDSLAIAERLAAADRSNTQWQRDLLVAYSKVGDVLVAQGKLDEALKAYRDSLAIAERLAAADRSNTQWQRDLSVSYERHVAVLVGSAENAEGQARVTAFQQTLRSLGWTDRRSMLLEVRWAAAHSDRTRMMAQEMQETRTIPIVFVNVSDPVGSGFVASLARPDGTATGFISNEPSVAGKWLQLLKDIAPQIRRAKLLFNPQTAPRIDLFLNSFETAARLHAVEPIAAPVREIADIESTMAAAGSAPDEGVVIMADIYTVVYQAQIVAAAAQYRVPVVYHVGFFARNGGLAAYGVDITELFRRGAGYCDRILRGEKPADLLVQAPTKFELVINQSA